MANNSSPKKYQKKYKCPYCDDKYDRDKLIRHIQSKHEELIPEGYTAARVVFNTINNKTVGHCIICGAETEWNEDKRRYERLCKSPTCKKKYLKMVDDRLKKTKGMTKSEMLSDPDFQDKMLKGRSISGTYKFSDGGVVNYVGSYEKDFLQFLDKYLNVKSIDIQSPGPTIQYYYEGKAHFWITDFYYIPYNLVLDIKDGGDNPNKRDMASYRAKQVAKEKAIKDLKQYNYLRLTNKQYDQLIDIFLDLKDSMVDMEGSYNQKVAKIDPIIRINEGLILQNFDNPVIGSTLDMQTELMRAITNPYTYISGKGLEKVEQIIKECNDQIVLIDYNTYLQTALVEHAERWVEYNNLIHGGKANYVMQYTCEVFQQAGVTLDQMNVIGQKLKDLKKIIESKIYGIECNISEDTSITQLTESQLKKYYNTILESEVLMEGLFKKKEEPKFDIHDYYKITESMWKSKYRKIYLDVYKKCVMKARSLANTYKTLEVQSDKEMEGYIAHMDGQKGGPNDRKYGLCTKAIHVAYLHYDNLPDSTIESISKQIVNQFNSCIPSGYGKDDDLYFFIKTNFESSGINYLLIAASIIMGESATIDDDIHQDVLQENENISTFDLDYLLEYVL